MSFYHVLKSLVYALVYALQGVSWNPLACVSVIGL